MRVIVALISSLFIVNACSSDYKQTDDSAETVQSGTVGDSTQIILDDTLDLLLPPADSLANDPISLEVRYTSEVYETAHVGWGYRIFDNGTLFINQPHIPAVQGNKGFSSKEKAQKTADLAIKKLNQGISPPTISVKELQELGVLD